MGCACRAPTDLTAGRSWSNAPALDSETEIELTVENRPYDCDLPVGRRSAAGLVTQPATQRLDGVPTRARNSSLSRRTAGTRRLRDAHSLYVRYRSPLGLAERWARAPLDQRVRVYPHCGPARNRKSSSRAAARSICNCARRGSADWAATLKASANTARATTCATSAGLQRRGAAPRSRASIKPSAASRCGLCSTAAA
jgi:hypothetical protein